MKAVWRFLWALWPALYADPTRLTVFGVGLLVAIVGICMMTFASWPTLKMEVQKAMAEEKASKGGSNITVNNPTFNAPSIIGDHNTQQNIFTDPSAYFLPAHLEDDADGVRVIFPVGGGTSWAPYVSFRIRLRRPCTSWDLDDNAFFPVRRMGGVIMTGGAWIEWFGTQRRVATSEIQLSVKNTPLPNVRAVPVTLKGVTRDDVLLAEADPRQDGVPAVR